ncbi:hypothetical protein FUAX_14030 [Fulvitalea axinellae]|uniref:Uncharacterized protein n=1 Tax=Fulvitalea axinellae TaxID=1182444 RepID=A0AAU9CJ66_9BACT|nr:hypothetical protein FUAX_14030 [Fulvitalea axinellae]
MFKRKRIKRRSSSLNDLDDRTRLLSLDGEDTASEEQSSVESPQRSVNREGLGGARRTSSLERLGNFWPSGEEEVRHKPWRRKGRWAVNLPWAKKGADTEPLTSGASLMGVDRVVKEEERRRASHFFQQGGEWRSSYMEAPDLMRDTETMAEYEEDTRPITDTTSLLPFEYPEGIKLGSLGLDEYKKVSPGELSRKLFDLSTSLSLGPVGAVDEMLEAIPFEDRKVMDTVKEAASVLFSIKLRSQGMTGMLFSTIISDKARTDLKELVHCVMLIRKSMDNGSGQVDAERLRELNLRLGHMVEQVTKGYEEAGGDQIKGPAAIEFFQKVAQCIKNVRRLYHDVCVFNGVSDLKLKLKDTMAQEMDYEEVFDKGKTVEPELERLALGSDSLEGSVKANLRAYWLVRELKELNRKRIRRQSTIIAELAGEILGELLSSSSDTGALIGEALQGLVSVEQRGRVLCGLAKQEWREFGRGDQRKTLKEKHCRKLDEIRVLYELIKELQSPFNVDDATKVGTLVGATGAHPREFLELNNDLEAQLKFVYERLGEKEI